MKKQWSSAISEDAKRQGALLRRIRESSQLTMRQLAMQVGISHPAISQLEHGKLELPRHRIEAIVLACGYKVEDFDRLSGARTALIDYRSELLSAIQKLDDDVVKNLFPLVSRLAAKQ